MSRTIQRCQGHYPTSQGHLRRFWLQKHGKLPPDREGSAQSKDWHEYDQKLAEVYGWSPLQIDQMTLPEIYAVLFAKAEQSANEIWEQVQAAKKLTPAEKLELAKFVQEA